jgi:hypothetical protein
MIIGIIVIAVIIVLIAFAAYYFSGNPAAPISVTNSLGRKINIDSSGKINYGGLVSLD